jgi:hypothetical protein
LCSDKGPSMSDAIVDIREALSEMGKILVSFRHERNEPSSPEKVAIRAVWSAVDATKIYIGTLSDGTPPNRELAELWSNAAINIAAFDRELAQRLRLKAEYWSDPGSWNADQIESAGISIENIANETRALLQLAVPKPSAVAARDERAYSLFLSHASEDKTSIVDSLAKALQKAGIRVWYDKLNLKLGDNLATELDKGLSQSQFGIVILSKNFFAKKWTRAELSALLALEASDGRKRIIPIRHGISHEELLRFSPLVASRVTMSTDEGIEALTQSILSAISGR